MDNFPSELLTVVYKFLPWKDRLVSRRLFSKFLRLPCNKIRTAVLTLRDGQTSFSFAIKFHSKEKKELRTIEITEVAKTDCILTRSMEDEEKQLYKTTIQCSDSYQYSLYINAYMNLLFANFFHDCVQLDHLSSELLVRIQPLLASNINWEQDLHWLHLFTAHRELSQEERKLLEVCRDNYSLQFSPPSDFVLPTDFWEIVSEKLILDFGGTLEKDGAGADIVFEMIDNELIRQLVQKGQITFKGNIVTRVTEDYIMEYIEEALSGGTVMYNWALGHQLNGISRRRLQQFLRSHYFEAIGLLRYAKNIDGRKTMEGYHPDRLICQNCSTYFAIFADYACYRGKKSIEDPTHPFAN